eukprot:680138-Pelagomonas_calceolata.AAC.1
MAPFWCKLGKRGGLSAWLGVSAMRARVRAAGGVEAIVQDIIPNFQNRDIAQCVIVWRFSWEGNSWTCKPVVVAWKGRYAWASVAQFLLHNSTFHCTEYADGCRIEKGADCYPFVWVVLFQGGSAGGWWVRGVRPKIYTCLWAKLCFTPPAGSVKWCQSVPVGLCWVI